MQNEIVTRESQDAAGLLRKAQRGYVSATPDPRPNLPPAITSHSTIVDVPANAIQVVSVQTTEVDRSRGYLLRSVPLYIAFAVGMVIVAVALFEEPVLSWTAFIVFWLSMVGAWMFGEYKSAQSSPYAANIMEIRRKWDNIDRNDMRRWDAWERITGVITPTDSNGWVERYKVWIIAWGVATLAWVVFVGVVLLIGGLR